VARAGDDPNAPLGSSVHGTAPFNATLLVKVGSTTVRTFTESAATELDYLARSVDLSAFANGQAHEIRFEYSNPGGSGVSSFYLDDITLECTANGQ
jgi:bacillopeptidase F (M6 metalloprotease family)